MSLLVIGNQENGRLL